SHIVQDGLRRMYGQSDAHPHGEDVIYYMTVYNEPTVQPKEPENLDGDRALRGVYPAAVPPPVANDGAPRVQLLASGVGFPWITDAQRMLADEWGGAAGRSSVASRDAL